MRDTRVLLIEDDPYARTMMELLLRRDWRTRVAASVNHPRELRAALESLRAARQRVDLVLVDTDIPGDTAWLPETLAALRGGKARVLFTGVAPRPALVERLPVDLDLAGYVIKDEIRFGLGWAAVLAAAPAFACTPGVEQLYAALGRRLPPGALVLDGRRPPPGLSAHEAEVARIAFLFSLERGELADEMQISVNYTYTLTSSLYQKLGLAELISGEVPPEDVFGDQPLLLEHVRKALRQAGGKKKAQELETIAFHLLTMPLITAQDPAAAAPPG